MLQFSSLLYSLHYGCPTDIQVIKKLEPCACSQPYEHSSWKTVVTCTGFTDHNSLRFSLHALHGYKIDDLILYALNMAFLPNDVFIDIYNGNKVQTEIDTVVILASVLPDIAETLNAANHDRSFFTGLGSSLRELRVESSSRITNYNWTRLAESLYVPPIDYSKNTEKYTTLALKNIVIYNNEMITLPQSFDSMSNFEKRLLPEKVLLHFNVIKTIDARLLFPKMKILDLSGNQIASTGNLFNKTLESSMKKENYNIDSLETFIIKKNLLTNLNEKNSALGDLITNRPNNLTYIDLTETRIDCKCENMEWIYKLKLDKNFLGGTCYSPPEMAGKPFTDCLPNHFYQ
jgi:hypothetical protein